jgi:signal transduction histidine kinase
MIPSAVRSLDRLNARRDSNAMRRNERALAIMTSPWLMAASAPDNTSLYLLYLIGALLLIQTGLIIALLVQNRRRRRAERDAENLQVEMTHAARLAMAGEITASIAHEVTQPLSAILSNVETAELLLSQPHTNNVAIGDILADIKRDDLRANEIVRRLRTLLRKREVRFEPLDINALIASVATLVRADASRRSTVLRTELAEGLPMVDADPVHLQQVMLNLLLNAMDAMDSTPATDRWLEIRTRLTDSGAVEVAVMDTGHGMTPDQLTKVFESFFTTKEGGMGLGLSIARSIVQAHGGKIWAESRESAGSTFHFTLPSPLQDSARLAHAYSGG